MRGTLRGSLFEFSRRRGVGGASIARETAARVISDRFYVRADHQMGDILYLAMLYSFLNNKTYKCQMQLVLSVANPVKIPLWDLYIIPNILYRDLLCKIKRDESLQPSLHHCLTTCLDVSHIQRHFKYTAHAVQCSSFEEFKLEFAIDEQVKNYVWPFKSYCFLCIVVWPLLFLN